MNDEFNRIYEDMFDRYSYPPYLDPYPYPYPIPFTYIIADAIRREEGEIGKNKLCGFGNRPLTG
jgi:hypothetical protein